MTNLIIKELSIYPVKSCAGFSLKSSHLGATGLTHDRSWMVIDEQGIFLTQRSHPQMALIETAIDQEQLILSSFGMEPHTVPKAHTEMERCITEVWDDSVNAIKIAGPTSDWLSQALGTDCHLVAFPQDELRQCDPEYAQQGEHTQFSDAYPLLILTEASLHGLNTRLDQPVGMNRFRPNIVIAGAEAHEEDEWSEITVADLRIRMVKDCPRCSVPTVDPTTGMLAGPEPMHTLSSYRTKNGEIMFGQNAIADNYGRLSVGDTVKATYRSR